MVLTSVFTKDELVNGCVKMTAPEEKPKPTQYELLDSGKIGFIKGRFQSFY